jgi:hypothetical protein
MIAGLKRPAPEWGQGPGVAVFGFGPPRAAALRLAAPFSIVSRFVATHG